jgi:hypothetical protein
MKTQEERFVELLKEFQTDYELRYTIGEDYKHHYVLHTGNFEQKTTIHGMADHHFTFTFDKSGTFVNAELGHYNPYKFQ